MFYIILCVHYLVRVFLVWTVTISYQLRCWGEFLENLETCKFQALKNLGKHE